MNASDIGRCPNCGAEIRAGTGERLCPACLLSGAIDLAGEQTRTLSMAPAGPPSRFGPSEFPCDFGEYRLHGLLGRGGMGTVYDAEHVATGRRLALKMLGQQLDTPEMRQRFLREGRLAARVTHPNSLYIFGSEEIDGLPVITMEIAGAGTLKGQLKQRGPLPVAEAVDAVLDVIAGLESAHGQGVLHRDIKPSNCFVCPDGSVKVGDFGLSVSTLAKTDTLITTHGRIMGTPAYAAPEQLRGDALDVRADIYSVGATLFTLLTDKAPFEGDNAVQVVANAVNQEPPSLTAVRADVPPGLARVVTRCLSKEPDARYGNYAALRTALLPYSSGEPEPASLQVRAPAGWIDYLVGFLPPYVALMLLVGPEDLLLRPVLAPTLYAARYYLLLFGLGFLYFGLAEGIWGAGLGKWLKGLRVVRTDGRPPGVGRALLRVVVPVLCCEGVRTLLMMAVLPGPQMGPIHVTMFVMAACLCPWIPGLLALLARREDGFATLWDHASGTRVVVQRKGVPRPALRPMVATETTVDDGRSLGPYAIAREVVRGTWLAAVDPVLRRGIWLFRRSASEETPVARRNVTRAGRPRWLQTVSDGDATWEAFEAPPGTPLARLIEDGERVSWAMLRHWLHDLASELWEAAADGTLPGELSIDHVWITAEGRAILLDEPWADVRAPAEPVAVSDLAGQQRFLAAVAAVVEPTSVPLHARHVLDNIKQHRFEKLSFLTGTLRGLLDKPADVSRSIRAAAILMLPAYSWIAVFVGFNFQPDPVSWRAALGGILVTPLVLVLGAFALTQLVEIPLRRVVGSAFFRLAVVSLNGEPASKPRLLLRWVITFVPLAVAAALALSALSDRADFVAVHILTGVWILAACYVVVDPQRGLHDRLASTWVVRR